MIKSPLISIITPSLNQGCFIEDAILSVIEQNYSQIEHIVIDGGSTDNTIEILKKYSKRIKWISEPDLGQANAINKGLLLSQGSILSYLNADDTLLPGALSRISNCFSENPQSMWIIGKCKIIDEKKREVRKLITFYKNMLLRVSRFNSLILTNYISQPSTFWRSEVIEQLGLLDESLHFVMDYEYWLRLYRNSPPKFLDEYLSTFKVHTNSKTTLQGHKKNYIDEEKTVLSRYTNSDFLLNLHNLHRRVMTLVYAIINNANF